MAAGLMERASWKREAVGRSLTEQPRRLGCRADRRPGQTVRLEGNLLRLEEKNHVSIRVPGEGIEPSWGKPRGILSSPRPVPYPHAW